MDNQDLPAGVGVRTYRIAPSRCCPSVEPIPADGYQHRTEQYTHAELSIVGKAIDEGIFYTDDVKDFCRDAWVALHPAVDQCLTLEGERNYLVQDPDDIAARRAQCNDLREKVAASPRGTWGLLLHRWSHQDGRTGNSWAMFISKGNGKVYEPQTSHLASRGRLPDYDHAHDCMVGYEIYLADGAEKRRREQARSRYVARQSNLHAGCKLKNLRVGATKYSSAEVEDVNEHGTVTLLLSKRGSRNRWRWTGLAQSIECDSVVSEMPAYGAMTCTEQ